MTAPGAVDGGLHADEILARLRARGATGLVRVALRANRSTIWSLTARRTVLNLHSAYCKAPGEVLDAFAVLVREAGRSRSSARYREARLRVARWPGLAAEMRRIRAAPTGRRPWASGRAPCCATPAQRVYLQRLYRWLNRTRFDDLLPPVVPIRLSRRFTRRLGQFVPAAPARAGAPRGIGEIALSADLMLVENDAARIDTLLHEMAHAANYLVEGEVGHGPRWRQWARRVGCRDRSTCSAPIHRRSTAAPSLRVPPLPVDWRAAGGAGGWDRRADEGADAAARGGNPPRRAGQARPRISSAASTTASAVSPNSR